MNLFLQGIPLSTALFAAALRFEQAERTRERRVRGILDGGTEKGLGGYLLLKSVGASPRPFRNSLKRAHAITLYLRTSIGDLDIERLEAAPAFRPDQAFWRNLHSLLAEARDHDGVFAPLMGTSDRQALMDVLDQSLRFRWLRRA